MAIATVRINAFYSSRNWEPTMKSFGPFPDKNRRPFCGRNGPRRYPVMDVLPGNPSFPAAIPKTWWPNMPWMPRFSSEVGTVSCKRVGVVVAVVVSRSRVVCFWNSFVNCSFSRSMPCFLNWNDRSDSSTPVPSIPKIGPPSNTIRKCRIPARRPPWLPSRPTSCRHRALPCIGHRRCPY